MWKGGMFWKRAAFLQVAVTSVDDESTKNKEENQPGRQWTKGIQYCIWFIASVLVANIILFLVAVGLAYNRHGTREFGYAPVYQGKCATAKNSATGIHLVINVLSTILLGASNYCMQFLAAPSRAEVDEAHQRRAWMTIGIPDFAQLFLRAPWRRRVLGSMLLVTSLPIHLIYNSAAYYSMQPQEYGVSVVHDIESLANPESVDFKFGYDRCFDEYIGLDSSELQQILTSRRYERLDKNECVNRFAQDYLNGQKAVIVVTNTSMPSDVPLVYVGSGNDGGAFANQYTTTYQWMCSGLSSCDARVLREKVNDWTVEAYRWFSLPLLNELDGFQSDSTTTSQSDNGFQCTESGATMEMQLPQFTVDHCLSITVEESCQLVFLPPVCLIVIFCNVVKLVCIILAARDEREDVFLNIGDAIASFLTSLDPTTEGAGLLSKDAVGKGAQGWHRNSLTYNPIPLSDMPSASPQHLPPRKRWAHAVSKIRWFTTILIFTTIIAPSSWLLSLGIKNVRQKYTSSIWAQGLGQPRQGTIITGLVNLPRTFPYVLALALLANTPQLLTSIAYFTYNTALTSMLAAVEYNSYYITDTKKKKTLRVSWPRGQQRSTYYLTLPYRYSLPLLATSALLHWLISQSFFFVEIVQVGTDWSRDPIITCGFSPVAMMFAIALGGILLLVAGALGCRRFTGYMPLIGYCSAAISAACHPGIRGDRDHALEPLGWGEVVDDEDGDIAETEGNGIHLMNWQAEMDRWFDERVYHCSFTSGPVVEPRLDRLYL